MSQSLAMNDVLQVLEEQEDAEAPMPVPGRGAAGHELLEQKEQLEQARPEMVTTFRSFRESFTQYRDVEKQFVRRRTGPRPFKPAPQGRFR